MLSEIVKVQYTKVSLDKTLHHTVKPLDTSSRRTPLVSGHLVMFSIRKGGLYDNIQANGFFIFLSS